MSPQSRTIAAILLIAVPTVQIGGLALLTLLTRRVAGYTDNPIRHNMFRAGHAHAGVWIVLALVALLYVDQTDLSEGLKWVVRAAVAVAPILVALGFFLSVLPPTAERPTKVVILVPLAGLSLAVGVLILGIGLLMA